MFGLLLGACAGHAVRLAELPEAPLAIRYRTPQESRERLELLEDLRGEAQTRAGVMRLGDLERVLGGGGLGARAARDRLDDAHLALLNPRDSRVRPLRNLPRNPVPLDWASGRGRLLLAATVKTGRQLFELDPASGLLDPATYGPEEHPMGCYLSEELLAVAQATPARNPVGAEVRIGVTERRGGAVRLLSPGPLDLDPACSPDGRRIAFNRAVEDGSRRIAVVEADGKDVRELVPGVDPAFTPDGEWIVYSAPTSKGQRIWRVRPDGSGRAPVGRRWESDVDEVSPAVSPDGRFVAYVLREGDREHLRLRRLDGQGDRPLLEHGDGFSPVW